MVSILNRAFFPRRPFSLFAQLVAWPSDSNCRRQGSRTVGQGGANLDGEPELAAVAAIGA